MAGPAVQARSAEVRRLVAALQLGEGENPSSGEAGAPSVRLSPADVSAALLSLSALGRDVLFEAEMEALIQVRHTPRRTAQRSGIAHIGFGSKGMVRMQTLAPGRTMSSRGPLAIQSCAYLSASLHVGSCP